MNRDFLDHLDDMLAYATKVREFLGEMGWDAFQSDLKTQFAVVRALEVVGEAARPYSTRGTAAISFDRMASHYRNAKYHDNADSRIVYDTATKFVPPLIDRLRTVIAQENKQS
ncbi:MAG TPA: HepT-like ribonuclease domain-containing protein [Stellaceae bacterium]|nr:HepT-like ribonuclease domain-containing protein [Stellaceae bacterium]